MNEVHSIKLNANKTRWQDTKTIEWQEDKRKIEILIRTQRTTRWWNKSKIQDKSLNLTIDEAKRWLGQRKAILRQLEEEIIEANTEQMDSKRIL